MMKTLFIRILRFLMLLIFIASCGIGYVIYEDTLTAWWIPLGMALLIALVTIPFYKKWIWLTTMDGKVINCLCHLACIGAISYGPCNVRRAVRQHAGGLRRRFVVQRGRIRFGGVRLRFGGGDGQRYSRG